jgi:FAD/FMN-containing dehydrogenase
MFRSTTPSWSASPGVVLRQSAQQLNDHRLKPAVFLGCSDLGTSALWHFGTLALWHFGTLALWHFGTLALWHLGTLALCAWGLAVQTNGQHGVRTLSPIELSYVLT